MLNLRVLLPTGIVVHLVFKCSESRLIDCSLVWMGWVWRVSLVML